MASSTWSSAFSSVLSRRMTRSRSLVVEFFVSFSAFCSTIVCRNCRSSRTCSASSDSLSIPVISPSLRIWSIAFSFWSYARRSFSIWAEYLTWSSFRSLIFWFTLLLSASYSRILVRIRFSSPLRLLNVFSAISPCFRNVSGSARAFSTSTFSLTRSSLTRPRAPRVSSRFCCSAPASFREVSSFTLSCITSSVMFSMSSLCWAIWGSIIAR